MHVAVYTFGLSNRWIIDNKLTEVALAMVCCCAAFVGGGFKAKR